MALPTKHLYMTRQKLFQEFDTVSSKLWKQKIQVELKGADYNDTLVWESLEGIKVKPFYHKDEAEKPISIKTNTIDFSILQNIYVHDVKKSNEKALETLKRGAESILFTLESETLSLDELFKDLPTEKTTYYLSPLFLSPDFIVKTNTFGTQKGLKIIFLTDPIGKLVKEGNWFENLESDFKKINQIANSSYYPYLSINLRTYQNAGANIVQQLAYTLAHLNEYFNQIPEAEKSITIQVSVGSNYFFEIAKLRALRLLFQTLTKEYNSTIECHIIASPTKRNKTLYDYNVNMLRTTTECMSAILGGADAVSNIAYDSLYHKENEFGDRISRNQLLILKQESYFDKVNNPTEGSYYIENITKLIAEKALDLFKDIEANGGFITQLVEGTIQRKIKESADKEQTLFNEGKEILLGTNKYPNKDDKMKHELELYPFVKNQPRKTLIVPIIERRLAEKLEQERLAQES